MLVHSDYTPLPCVREIDGLTDALYQVAIWEEWLGPGEKPEADDCLLVYIREARDNCSGTPGLRQEVLWMLPAHEHAVTQCRLAGLHVQAVEARASVCWQHEREAYDGWLAEARRHQKVWDLVETVVRQDGQLSWRRVALGDLQGRLGESNLELGLLPPALPAWRFQRVGD